MRVVCIGDSCTYGQNVRADEAWPHLLAGLTGWDVRNAGVCGDTTRLALERFGKDVQLHGPDVVVVQFGHNDANCWATDNGLPRVSRAAYAANILEMGTRCERMVVLRPHRTKRDVAYDRRLALYRAAVDGLDPPEPVTVLDDGYGVHPDAAMHARYARLVADTLA